MSRRRPLLTAVLTALTLAPPAQAAITKEDVREPLTALQQIADANGGTRAAGTPGYARSADLVASRLAAAGWQVTRQPVTYTAFVERGTPVLTGAKAGRDFATLRYSGAGDVRGRVRLVEATSCGARPFRGLRRGQIALIDSGRCTYRRVVQHAQRRGAVAAVLIDAPQANPIPGTLGGPGITIPVLTARLPTAQRLYDRRARTVRIRTDTALEDRTDDNVLAELPGGDRVVMAGGHLDSVPEGPGMNDNASGVALLLELAERLPAARRGATVRLGFWAAEELGLYGSKAYVKGLSAAERKRFSAYLNFDMVGSPKAVTELYRYDTRIRRVLQRAFPGAGLTRPDGASDHAPFRTAGIPVGGVYTGSFERARGGGRRDACYHRRCDDLDNVDLGVLARTATGAERAMVSLVRAG